MLENSFLNPLHTLRLISHEKHLNEFVKLYDKKLLPNALLLSGKKGIGKHTLINHFLNHIFNKGTETPYCLKKQLINKDSAFYNAVNNDLYTNIINFNAELSNKVKIDDIRKLKLILSKTNLDTKPRFIIINEVEQLNLNCANALLKILEEPTEKNYFILINNNQSKILETISSRCINHNIFLSPIHRKKIIENILEENSIKPVAELNLNMLTPGLYLEFNDILSKNNILLSKIIIETLSELLMLYKKTKNSSIIILCSFIIEQHFHKLIMFNNKKINALIYLRNNIIKNFKDLVNYNLNITSLLNSIEMKLKNVER